MNNFNGLLLNYLLTLILGSALIVTVTCIAAVIGGLFHIGVL